MQVVRALHVQSSRRQDSSIDTKNLRKDLAYDGAHWQIQEVIDLGPNNRTCVEE